MLIPLKLVRDQQLQQQIFDQLRDLIVSNRLRPGSRMPSSRMMAEQFAISRMTVLLTYERLIAEGYLDTRPAAGTFVAHPPARSMTGSSAGSSALSLAHPPANPLARPQSNSAESHKYDRVGSAGPEPEARVGGSDPSLFPVHRWRSLMRNGLDRLGTQFGSEHPAGSPALRDAIASWLSTSRGLAVSADQVMLVKGRQQALHVVAHLASRPCEGRRAMARSAGRSMEAPGGHHEGYREGPNGGHQNGRLGANHDNAMAIDQARIVVEDPCDADAAAAMAGIGSALVRVPVDADGLCTDHLPDGDAALVHVTPEHQRPLGVVLSGDRRTALLDWAARAGALILEEDIDGELRYGNMNVPSLMSLDRSERVILLGGFGVSLGPWLEMAYLVLPRWLVPFAQAARRLIDESRGGLEHTVLADFLESGGYARHLHRVTKACASRRDALIAALRRHFGEPMRVLGGHAGLHLTWFPPPDRFSPGLLATLARRHGLDAAALGDDAVLLGFGVSDEQHIETGVRRMAEALTVAKEGLPPVPTLSIDIASTIARRALI